MFAPIFTSLGFYIRKLLLPDTYPVLWLLSWKWNCEQVCNAPERSIGMIARLLVIMKQTQSDDVGLALLNSLTEIPEENLDGIQGNLENLDATATQEEAILFKLLEHKIPHIVNDAGILMDGGAYIDADGIAAENPKVFAHFLANRIRHPDRKEVSWDEIEGMIAAEVAGHAFLPLEEESKIIELNGGKA
jgi:hypothetical protein